MNFSKKIRQIVKVNRGGSKIPVKGVHVYKGVEIRFADFISFS